MTSCRRADRATVPSAASTLLGDLLAGAPRDLVEVSRTRLTVHYETGDEAVPVLCTALPEAVRLPNALVTSRLPGRHLQVGDGGLVSACTAWTVTRWWRPARPSGLDRPRLEVVRGLTRTSYDVLDPMQLLGRGRGLTPEGDDVLAGALVAAHATGDARLGGWRSSVRQALAARRTTAVSRALLHHALDGYAVAELADVLETLCSGRDPGVALARLRGVGHSSGRALLDGALHVLTTSPDLHEGAA